MLTRAACYNCGLVDYYTLPYHAKIVEFDRDEIDSQSGYYEDGDERLKKWLCSNCGWEQLIVLYHDTQRSADPLETSKIDTARS